MVRMKKAGVTLAELVLLSAALGILSFALPRIFLQMNKVIVSTSGKLQAQNTLVLATRHIEQLLSSARRSTVTIYQIAGESPYSAISYINNKNESMAMYQKDQALVVERDGKVSTLIHGNVSQVSFFYQDLQDDSRIGFSMASSKNVSNHSDANQSLGFISQIIKLEYM